MMKKPLLIISGLLTLHSTAYVQDSTYYSVLWSSKNIYRQAGVRQEGVFIYRCKNGIINDSFLLQTKIYDSLGQITRLEEYQTNKLRTRFTYFYSGFRLDSMLQEEVWLPSKLIHHYIYDDNGNVVIDKTFNGSKKTIQKRYTYNIYHQPLQNFTQVGDETEYLSMQFAYRSDHLIRQTDYYYSKAESGENFSYLYTYSKNTKTSTRFFQRMSSEQRFVDCIRTYNEKQQLITKINSPLRKTDWLPPDLHPRNENIETTSYLPNGMVAERQTRVDDQLVLIERHFYQ